MGLVGIILNTSNPVKMTAVAPIDSVNLSGGAFSANRKYERPVYKFTLNLTEELKEEAMQVFGAMSFLQGDTLFWFDGGENGDISEYITIGLGDAARVDFFVPNRNVYAPSLVVKVNGVVTTAWTFNESTGMITFTSAPAADSRVEAKYKCRYKAVFTYGADKMYDQIDHFKYFSERPIQIREVFP